MSEKTEKHSRALRIWARLRNYFLAGILITAPFGLTIYLAWLFIAFVDERVFGLLPPEYNPETYLPFSVPGIGLIIAIVALTLIGALTAGFVGRLFHQLITTIFNRLPVIRSVYSGIKQIFDTIFANQATAFRQVVLIEYPRKGIWTIGFIAGNPQAEILGHLGEDTRCVFVPTAPNPTSGFLLMVNPTDIIPLKMSVDEGIKWVISGGLASQPSSFSSSKSQRPIL